MSKQARRSNLPKMAVAALWLWHSLSLGAELVLVEAGQSAGRIVIPADHIPSERYAAEELQRHIARITGSSLPIVTDAEPAGTGEIVLGATTRSPDAVSLPQADGFVLRCDGKRLFIQGA